MMIVVESSMGILLCVAVLLGGWATASLYPSDLNGIYRGAWNSDPLGSGQMFMQVIEEHVDDPRPAYQLMRGEIVLRQHDDPHNDAYLIFAGAYVRATGAMLLFSNVPNWNRRPDFQKFVGSRNGSEQYWPEIDMGDGVVPVRTFAAIGNCRFTMELQVLPLIFGDNREYDPDTGDTVWRQGSRDIDRASIQGILISDDCHLNVSIATARTQSTVVLDRASGFATMASGLTIIQMLFTVRQVQHTGRLGEVSMWAIALQSLLDAYLCVNHIGVAMRVPGLWLSFMVLTMFEFLLFSLFQVRLLFLIWKANHRNAFDIATAEERRNMINNLNTRLYIFIFGGLLLIFYTGHDHEFLTTIVLHSPWVAQIIHNVYYDVSRGLLPNYILVMAASRLVLPLYQYGDPENYMETPTNYTFCFCLVLWIMTQVALLLGQHHLGSRFFIAGRFLPAKYNYYQSVPVTNEDICAICMMEITEDVETQQEEPQTIMVTPCNHLFHSICLITWMEQKMECPSCRGPLPSL
ncbi:hypothetical protein PBRA_002224 [Plasmodiophora brassicae]|uniref:RING-type E3 ubiquitin transferase n=2 Tax=Plasmodiophora brassicae TaxID=37360 RepID=A0A0G4J3J7_PLABS|nr:hypothetical protein PBRA_002224 [Plasmodiophora brassicae]